MPVSRLWAVVMGATPGKVTPGGDAWEAGSYRRPGSLARIWATDSSMRRSMAVWSLISSPKALSAQPRHTGVLVAGLTRSTTSVPAS